MAIQLGDRVRFVNENIEGTVTRIIDQRMLGVTTDDDFEIPVLRSEVVKVAFQDKKTNEEDAEHKKKAQVAARTELGIFLLFEPKSDRILQMKICNLLSAGLLYTLGTLKKEQYRELKRGSLSLDEEEVLLSCNLEEFSEWPAYVFNFIPCTPQADDAPKPIQCVFKPNAKEFHGSFKFSSIIQKQAYVFRLDERLNLFDLQKLRNRDFAEKGKNNAFSQADEVQEIVDLHISAIPDAPATLKPHEILQVQFAHFKRQMEKGLTQGLEKMVFIHGIGDGVLKRKIREFLHGYSKVKNVQDADELKYGKGATEIWF